MSNAYIFTRYTYNKLESTNSNELRKTIKCSEPSALIFFFCFILPTSRTYLKSFHLPSICQSSKIRNDIYDETENIKHNENLIFSM